MKTPHDDWPWWLRVLLFPCAIFQIVSESKWFFFRWSVMILIDVAFVVWLLTYSRRPVVVSIESYSAETFGPLVVLFMIALHLIVLVWKEKI